MDEESALKELAAALNGRQMTDDNGQLAEEQTTSAEESAASESKTTEDETAGAEKPEESTEAPSRGDDDEDETNYAEDESGKRYVPEARLKKETAKYRETERRLKALEAQLAKGSAQTRELAEPETPTQPVDRTEVLEVEMLKSRMPEFDPESEVYDPALDRLGAQILKANPGMTRIQAARQARDYAKALTAKMNQVKDSARTVKAQQSDQGITSRVTSRQASQPDPMKMSLAEKEEFLKANGSW